MSPVVLVNTYAPAGTVRFGAANRVTAVRAALVTVVGMLVVVALAGRPHPGMIGAVSAVALGLDFVDGQVARRTGTVSAFGARFDMEVDAALILVLSVVVAPSIGWWVLLIGLARYLSWTAERFVPWLLAPVPPRRWRKVVAAIQGVTLAVVAAELMPHAVATAALAVALLLLTESFLHDVWWLRLAAHDNTSH